MIVIAYLKYQNFTFIWTMKEEFIINEGILIKQNNYSAE
jgi:hypothetical protein